MKRVIFLMLALSLLLCACSSSPAPAPAETARPAAETAAPVSAPSTVEPKQLEELHIAVVGETEA